MKKLFILRWIKEFNEYVKLEKEIEKEREGYLC